MMIIIRLLELATLAFCALGLIMAALIAVAACRRMMQQRRANARRRHDAQLLANINARMERERLTRFAGWPG
jgi:uncharacterized membrane protein